MKTWRGEGKGKGVLRAAWDGQGGFMKDKSHDPQLKNVFQVKMSTYCRWTE
jgi:hypothetical protein